jgi:hypothetical protein
MRAAGLSWPAIGRELGERTWTAVYQRFQRLQRRFGQAQLDSNQPQPPHLRKAERRHGDTPATRNPVRADDGPPSLGPAMAARDAFQAFAAASGGVSLQMLAERADTQAGPPEPLGEQ